MSSLACVDAEVNESTGSAFLIAFQQHAAAVDFFKPVAERLQVKMKTVRYSILQKVQTLVASILLGCPHTSSINHRLVPDQVAAHEWGMERFPDQSQINIFLNWMTAENLAQLEQAHYALLHLHSRLRSASEVVVDFDQTGLRVTGRTYELAEKGYFPRRRGARGYQLSAAVASAQSYEPEAIADYLDPGNVVGPTRLADLLSATLLVFEQRGPELVIRLDAGYGVASTVTDLLEAGIGFVLKWRDPRPAKKIVQEHQPQWQRQAKDVRVAEGPSYLGVRSVISEVKGEFTMLLTNLDHTPQALFEFYNQRQTIEALFKASEHVYGMANLRSRRYLAIAAFLGFVFLTHNLLVWTKAALFRWHQARCHSYTRDGGEDHQGTRLSRPPWGQAPARTAKRWRGGPGIAAGPQPDRCSTPTALFTFVEKLGSYSCVSGWGSPNSSAMSGAWPVAPGGR